MLPARQNVVSQPGFRLLPWLLLATLAVLFSCGPALAQETGVAPAIPAGQSELTITAGTGQVVALSEPAASVFAADPKVAEVRPASPTTLFVFGVAPGQTTIAALDKSGHPIAQYLVTVAPSGYGAAAAEAEIARLVPAGTVQVSAQPNGLVVQGDVATPAQAAEVMAAARSYVPQGQTVDDELTVLSSVQVDLKVRIAEMSRMLVRELGINWQALGSIGRIGRFTADLATNNALAFNPTAAGVLTTNFSNTGVDITNIIDALAQDQLVRMLAEPTLTAMSGQTASFLVGGEFPIPVAQQLGAISIQFQPFGVSLAFVPVVQSDGRITMRVKPEVSELTTQGAVQLSAANSAISVPALLVRRAETTVELGSGQSFAIAGLLQDSITQADSGLPGLGDIPILGALFRSDSFQRQQSELVIVVTPYIVRPVDNPDTLKLPGADYVVPSDLERILLLRQEGHKAPSGVSIPGQAGFIVQ